MVLRASVPRQGVFNLNRFEILLRQTDKQGASFLLGHHKVKDQLMVGVEDTQRGSSSLGDLGLLL